MKKNIKKCRIYCKMLMQKIIHKLTLIVSFELENCKLLCTFSVIQNLMPVCFGLKITKVFFYLVCWAKTGYMSSSTQQSYSSLDNLLYMHIRYVHLKTMKTSKLIIRQLFLEKKCFEVFSTTFVFFHILTFSIPFT